ncbi:hypothetical protein HPB52_006174 [Rhipicephalus sanguineus]|uniref:Uncharacterized protein n=1 Tax=Rhipicephalus sanguineus TaxID=34632 RepID=A0A9D4T8U4_RHISA|nr:hypothetical protein HPB52_006174 [Rhipicephalus sanguineus]
MQDISPFPIAKAIKECINGDYDARKMSSGDLLIEVHSEQQSNNSKKLNKIARKRVEFAQKGSCSQAVQRGRVPQIVSVSTQVQLQDLVSALQPSRRESGGAQRTSSTRGLEVCAAAGTSQRSTETTQTSLTVLKGRLPTKKPTLSQSTSSEEHLCGAVSMEVCPADREESGEAAANSKPLKQPVVAPTPLGRGKGSRHPVRARERALDRFVILS